MYKLIHFYALYELTTIFLAILYRFKYKMLEGSNIAVIFYKRRAVGITGIASSHGFNLQFK